MNEDLAGKDAVFEVDVKEIQESEAVTIGDDFAKGHGFDDLAATSLVQRDLHVNLGVRQSERALEQSGDGEGAANHHCLLLSVRGERVFAVRSLGLSGDIRKVTACSERSNNYFSPLGNTFC